MKILCETYYLGEYHDKKRRLNGFSAISGIVACDFRKAYNRCFREKTGKKASDSVGKFLGQTDKVSDSVGRFFIDKFNISDLVGHVYDFNLRN
ncbi:MAG: hypothetical protein LBT50_01520 [Prevotellaceae bacterium]|jgi:hypothetical protein|nr:hypothetical protein [Prevotellaceae bacterium]